MPSETLVQADIMKAFKDSFADAHAFADGITPENAFAPLRMNGIVPPG